MEAATSRRSMVRRREDVEEPHQEAAEDERMPALIAW